VAEPTHQTISVSEITDFMLRSSSLTNAKTKTTKAQWRPTMLP
jgi:hypothetical protein